MGVITITSLDDPRIAAYRNVKDRELERRGARFLAEGEHLCRRLFASGFPVESMLLADRRTAEIAPLAPVGVPVYEVPQTLMNEIMGLKFHSGVLACGVRPRARSIDEMIPRGKERLTLVICPEISNGENLGSMIRIAAGLGADAMVLGEKCHDPYWRQSIRVSMGTIFSLPLVQSKDIGTDLKRLRDEWGVQLAATVLDADAEPLAGAKRPAKFGLLFGSEAQGIEERYVAMVDRRITIPMHWGTDSLNVAVAAGIFLHHFGGAG